MECSIALSNGEALKLFLYMLLPPCALKVDNIGWRQIKITVIVPIILMMFFWAIFHILLLFCPYLPTTSVSNFTSDDIRSFRGFLSAKLTYYIIQPVSIRHEQHCFSPSRTGWSPLHHIGGQCWEETFIWNPL